MSEQKNNTMNSFNDKIKLSINGIEWLVPFTEPPQDSANVDYQKITLWILTLLKDLTQNEFTQNQQIKMILVLYSDSDDKGFRYANDFGQKEINSRFVIIPTLYNNDYILYLICLPFVYLF